MSTKFLLFFLGTLLLVQCALANVTGRKSESEEIAAALDFFGNSMFRSFHLIDKTYEFSRTILEPAVAKVTVTNDVTKTPMQKYFEELQQYLEKSRNLDADDEHKNKAAFLRVLDKILDDIKETERTTSNFSALDRSVLNAIENFKTETNKEIATIATHIVADAEDYWEEMGPAKRQEKQKFHATISLLKNETDPEKKAELISTLLESAGSDE